MTPVTPTRYNQVLLIVAGLGGLLYGIDVGIIGGALPYLDATSSFSAGQLSFIVAAVLLGSVISTLFAGALADRLGRRLLMTVSGLLFVVSIPTIALSDSFAALIAGRLLQGISAGLIGVVIPLYLAECLTPEQRGRGTAMFQWMLTFGIVLSALIGMFFSYRVGLVEKTGDTQAVLAYKEWAWRCIFWSSLPPGVLFVFGALYVSDSPRWLARKNRIAEAKAALERSRGAEGARQEWREIEEVSRTPERKDEGPAIERGSLLQRKYVFPFLLACLILACNQTTGVNSILGYNTSILIQSGLSDLAAHWGYVIITAVNFLVTMVGVALIDRKGRKFLLSLGTAGIVVSLLSAGFLFRQTESRTVDCAAALQSHISAEQRLVKPFTELEARALWAASAGEPLPEHTALSLVVIYRYGDYRSSSSALRSDFEGATLRITREASLPANGVIGFFSRPFGDLDAARGAPLVIEHARLSPVPSEKLGWFTAIALFSFMGFFAVGPGVCVWLALSELMPSRIRSNGMSIALLINQAVSTLIAGFFLPTVGRYGHSTLFFIFAGCTVVYWLAATFVLPETKGKTLEEIESHFARK